MTITNHAVNRFQERVTFESPEVIRMFIKLDIKKSTHLYRIKDIEKRINNGVIYVLDLSNELNPVVVTLYLAK